MFTKPLLWGLHKLGAIVNPENGSGETDKLPTLPELIAVKGKK